MNANSWERFLHFTRGKMRVVLSWLLLIFLVYAIDKNPQWPGILVMLAGAMLRCISSGYIDKEGRLSVAGPYRFVRNPLYLGSILIAVGAALAQENILLLLFFTAAAVIVHLPIIMAEERVLKQKFGANYLLFLKNVPRLVPWRIWPKDWVRTGSDINVPKFSFSQWRENKGYEALFVFLAVVLLQFGVVAAKAYFSSKS